MPEEQDVKGETNFGGPEIGALAHLYRGELYRSTVWRGRLDTTTNWAVVSTGIALSVTYSSPHASPLPLMLVGLLVAMFLVIEARRYCFFDFWRIRAHILETQFFGPILLGRGLDVSNGWNETLYLDYRQPRLHISLLDALGRRLRRNYLWIFAIQAASFVGKLIVHPTPVATLDQFWARAAVGPLSGQAVVAAGMIFHGGWLWLAVRTRKSSRGRGQWRTRPTQDKVLELARQAA